MKRHFLLLCATAALLSSCSDNTKPGAAAEKSDSVTVEKDAPAPARVKPDSATQMKNWEAYATPGEMHKLLASWDGSWTGESTMWMSPDAPPLKSTVMATYKTILGGRYSEGVHTGNMMGMAFEGRSMTAYDNARKVFLSTWIDNMGTGVMYMEGTWDEATKTLTSKGKMVMPEMGDGSECNVKEIIRMEDADHQVMEMYIVDESGKETKTMEIHSTRKK